MARSVQAIRKKYGVGCFKKWGAPKSGGGSPVLKAWSQGRIPKSLVYRNHKKN